MNTRAGGEDPFYEIMRSLGRLEEGQKRQQEDVEEVKQTARESRDKTHAKLDHLEETIGIVGQVAAQSRAESSAVKAVLETEVLPVTEQVKRMQLMGIGGIAVIGFAFTVFGITVATLGQGFINMVRQWWHL